MEKMEKTKNKETVKHIEKVENKENKDVKELNWAVLGTGVIANEMAQALHKMGKSLYAVGNRTHQKAVDFAAKYGISKVYDSIDDMFEDENTDIIYITSTESICLSRSQSR